MSGPKIELNPEPTLEERTAMLVQLRKLLRPPPEAPTVALELLYQTACGDTGGSQASRHFLFWLAGAEDPTGYTGHGGLELRRLDGNRRQAALDVLDWWSGGVQSDEPLHEILRKLNAKFE